MVDEGVRLLSALIHLILAVAALGVGVETELEITAVTKYSEKQQQIFKILTTENNGGYINTFTNQG